MVPLKPIRLVALVAASLMPIGATANTLTHRDVVNLSGSLPDLGAIAQKLKTNRSPEHLAGNSASKLLHDGCVSKLRKAQERSFDGILTLGTLTNISAEMKTPQDENTALQGTAMAARFLPITLASERTSVVTAMTDCQEFNDIQTVGQSLLKAIDATDDLTKAVAQKLNSVRVDEGQGREQ